MIYSRQVRKNIQYLENQYQNSIRSPNIHIPIMYSKAGIIETCGWIEACFDEITRQSLRNKFRTKKSRSLIEKKIKNTHGFVYPDKTRDLICHAIGFERLIKIEKKLEKRGEITVLTTKLANLNLYRKEAAHTFVSNQTTQFPSPSVMLSEINAIEPILTQYWQLAQSP